MFHTSPILVKRVSLRRRIPEMLISKITYLGNNDYQDSLSQKKRIAKMAYLRKDSFYLYYTEACSDHKFYHVTNILETKKNNIKLQK